MSAHKKISESECFLYLEREVTQSRAEEIEAHLADCRDCRDECQRARELIRLVGEPDSGLAELDLVEDLHRAIESKTSPAPRRVWPVLTVAAAAVVALVVTMFVIYSQGTEEQDGIRIKSAAAPRPGLHVYQLDPGERARALGQRLGKETPLLFGYTNLGETPYGYLMIFAVDAAGEVYWYHPAYQQAGSDPQSLSIAASRAGVELPEAVMHDLPPGPLAIYGIFSRRPLRVSQIEKQFEKLTEDGTWYAARPGELALDETVQHILRVQVEP